MKRLRLDRLSGQLLTARYGATASSSSSSCPLNAARPLSNTQCLASSTRRALSTESSSIPIGEFIRRPRLKPFTNIPYTPPTPAPKPVELPSYTDADYPSPLPEKALESAKLAALHARLGLSRKIPLQTLARTLVDPTADANPNFNNANLAYLGATLINYHTSEYLLCKFPRLPMPILYEAMGAYAGPKSLYRVARQWGVETATFPGGEVDAGLLQFDRNSKHGRVSSRWGHRRKEAEYLDNYSWRRGISSRVIFDDPFGNMVHRSDEHSSATRQQREIDQLLTPGDAVLADRNAQEKMSADVHADHVRAVVGAILVHTGREQAKAFVHAHILSRRINVDSLFSFRLPTRELAMLCAREGFEAPIARLLSETGRQSRTPVFVVGIYSGRDKLGEGDGASLDYARIKAAMNALKGWYLYSPGDKVRVPSEMLDPGAKAWKPAYIDMGEII